MCNSIQRDALTSVEATLPSILPLRWTQRALLYRTCKDDSGGLTLDLREEVELDAPQISLLRPIN
jgi:hypothetical protein